MPKKSPPRITGHADLAEQGDTLTAHAKVAPLHEIIEEMARGGHAGSALIATSQLESAVQQLIIDKMPHLSKTLRERLFRGYGPFTSFSVKIDVAYALGQIDAATRHNLHVIRNIRNEFAHTQQRVYFGSQEIRALLQQFKPYDKNMDPFAFFIKRIDVCWDAIRAKMEFSTLIAVLKSYGRDKVGASPKKSE
jgi:DNA-binding MltR family transcriptional regulator